MIRKTLLSLLAAAALAGGAWFLWMRPSALENARKSLDRGDAAAAADILTKRLAKGAALRPGEETELRRALARACLMKGDYDGAEAAFRALLQKNPSDGEAETGLGFLFLARGQDGPAIDAFQKAKETAPGDLRPLRGLTALYNLRQDHDKAREAALELLNRAPADGAGRLALGEAELGRGLYADAAQAFEAVLKDDPSQRRARLLLARARLDAGDLSGAEEAIAPLLKDAPDDAAALSLQADYFTARARPDDAAALDRKIFDRDPQRLGAGVALSRSLARRDTARAEELLLDIAQRLPKPEDVARPSYAAFYEPWDVLEARRSLRRVRVDFNLAMGEVYRVRYLLADAERQASLALQAAPRDRAALRFLTEVKRLSGDPQEWLAAAARAADLLPQHPDVLLDKARALLAAKRPQEALTLAQAAAASCPSLSRAQAVLAEVRLALKDGGAAGAAVDKGLSLNDLDAEVHVAGGLVKSSKNDWKGAEASFARALELDPFLARAHAGRARALEHLGKKREAQQERDQALALEPRLYAGRT